MNHTKNSLISDIILQLTQGSPSDDLALEEDQVAAWIDYHLNDLVRREIIDYQKKGYLIPPIYIRRDIELDLQEENIADVDDNKQRIFVDLNELEEDILDLPRDTGIVRVLDYDRNLINKTSVEDIESIRNLRFAKPSPENVLYYREGKTILIIEGFNTPDIEFNPIMISYVPKQNVFELGDDDEVLITDQLVPILIDLCVQRGKLQLYGSQPDSSNDGKDVKQTQYHTAIQNPTRQESQPTEE